MPQNLISDKYYDLWLSIDTKNSPLSGILLLLQAAELRRSKMKIFKQKKVKISNFELQKRYIPQKKAKNIYNSDSARKSVNFCKKNAFFSIFLIFATCSRTPWNFWRSFFWKFQKIFQKWLYWVLSNIERNKVMNFGEPSPNPVETADWFWSTWAIMAPPRLE